MTVDETVSLSVIAMTAFLLAVVPAGEMAVFTILVLIGLLVVRALAGPYARGSTNSQVDVFIGLGLAIFVLIVLNRVFEVLSTG